MSIVVGIDEAGYGPPLGPLVITAICFEVDDHLSNTNLWQLLDDVVTSQPRGHRLAVGDSKRLYSRKKGLRRLEEGVLAFHYCLGEVTSLDKLLGSLSCYDEEGLKIYPWYYKKGLQIPLACPLPDVCRHHNLLKGTLSTRGVKFLGARSVAISPYEFNRELERGNKALLLFRNCVNLLDNMWKKYPRFEALCGKHGGRNRYGSLLAEAFRGTEVGALSEGSSISSYEVGNVSKDRWMKVSFIKGAEGLHLPVALASMYCKYIRELFLKLFNNFWQGYLPGLRPTAGYPTDARRFIKEIGPLRAQLGISDDVLIRKK